jgi:hypothetical protein
VKTWLRTCLDVTHGRIDVTTESHENPVDHQYIVSIDDVTKEQWRTPVHITPTPTPTTNTWPQLRTQPTKGRSTPSLRRTMPSLRSATETASTASRADRVCGRAARDCLPNPVSLFSIYVTSNNTVRYGRPANADRVCGYTDLRKDDTPTTERDLLDRAHAANVAAEHFPNLPVDAI